MKHKHTPGPWVVGAHTHDIRTEQGRSVALSIGQFAELGQSAANARLLAAAPELLHLLSELREEVRDWQVLCDRVILAGPLCEQIDAVIAKVEGR
jgi:hypothetical protein